MSIQLYILGTLVSGNYHPYMIKKKLADSLPSDTMLKISDGKLYYNFDTLQKKGYIEAVEVVHEDHRPDKTLYAITDLGRKALEEKIYNSFKNISNVRELYVSIYFLKYVDPQKVAFILEDQIQKEKEYRDKNNKIDPNAVQLQQLDEKTKQSVLFIAEHSFGLADLNIEWLEKVLEFVKNY